MDLIFRNGGSQNSDKWFKVLRNNQLDLLSKKRKGVTVEIYTSQSNCKLTETEIADFNKQYGGLTISYTSEFHDRFMILDKKKLYLIGASIKDAGKKTFEISQIEDEKHIEEILRRL